MILTLVFALTAAWGLEIPSQLTSSDQIRTLEILGLGTTSKFLSNAYPLGGYSGVEVSLAVQVLNTREISRLGDLAAETAEVHYPTLTLGKGLYNDADIFFHFTPASKALGISDYGMSLRWSFYQALFMPINFSLVAHANNANIRNRIRSRNLGLDLMMGMNLSQFSFFLGGGLTNSAGTFSGGTSGVTRSNETEKREVESSHFMFGATYNFDPVFVGISIDRYKEPVYSIKSGFLF